ncbi:MAG: AAA-like domain-containing protein [Pyrinomonadaceae bacterium]
MSKSLAYSVTGSLLDNGVYVLRKADAELLSLCRKGTFAFVLAPRQVGKSSLMAYAVARLEESAVHTVVIDLNLLGQQVTPDGWYLGHLVMIQDQLGLKTDVIDWWQEHTSFGPVQRLINFFRRVLLHELRGSVVIFVDEIERTRDLDFSDDFFAAIRYVYNARANEPEFRRLSFVLIGMATPDDLIHDPQRTPFNIGRRVEVTDFTLEEALPLAEDLGLPEPEARQTLGWVLKWTGGHPYLTQRLCRAVVEKGKTNWVESEIDLLVEETFLGEMSGKDINLLGVRDMIIKGWVDTREVLTLYRQIYHPRSAVRDEKSSPVKTHLKLAGIVHTRKKLLRVRNRIYNSVFNEEWIDECLSATRR